MFPPNQNDGSCEHLLRIMNQDFEDCVLGTKIESLSRDDRRASSIVEGSLKKEEGRYSLGLLSKDHKVRFGETTVLWLKIH